MFDLESQIRKWKNHVYSTGTISYNDMEELESHLRDSIDDLGERGISLEESFLIAVRRLGDVAVIHEEFAKISTEDIWRTLLVPADNPLTARKNRFELAIVIALALFAGLLSKIPSLFGYSDIEEYMEIYAKNAAIFAVTPVALYFIWKRSLPILRSTRAMTIFLLAALVINLYPSFEPHHSATLAIIHLPIALLFFMMYFYGGPALTNSSEVKDESTLHAHRPHRRTLSGLSGWRNPNTRLNFVRFVGETFIYAVLIGLGGIVLIFITGGTFALIDIDAFPFITSWVAPFGFFGLFTVAVYLVGQKKNLIESLAPVLARIFTPLFLLVLLSLIAAFLITPNQAYENREMLIWFDVILAIILALTLYSMSSKDFSTTDTEGTNTVPLNQQSSGKNAEKKYNPTLIWDGLTFALLIAAIFVDGIALSGIVFRLSASGFTPNRTAALGENILLLVNLLLLAVGYGRFIMGRLTFQSIVVMQMRFLPAYAVWAAFVVIVFPIIFNFR